MAVDDADFLQPDEAVSGLGLQEKESLESLGNNFLNKIPEYLAALGEKLAGSVYLNTRQEELNLPEESNSLVPAPRVLEKAHFTVPYENGVLTFDYQTHKLRGNPEPYQRLGIHFERNNKGSVEHDYALLLSFTPHPEELLDYQKQGDQEADFTMRRYAKRHEAGTIPTHDYRLSRRMPNRIDKQLPKALVAVSGYIGAALNASFSSKN